MEVSHVTTTRTIGIVTCDKYGVERAEMSHVTLDSWRLCRQCSLESHTTFATICCGEIVVCLRLMNSVGDGTSGGRASGGPPQDQSLQSQR